MSERDRTAMTGPLSTGQQIVAKWESVDAYCPWAEPADLADAIDDAIAAAVAAERERIIAYVEGLREVHVAAVYGANSSYESGVRLVRAAMLDQCGAIIEGIREMGNPETAA